MRSFLISIISLLAAACSTPEPPQTAPSLITENGVRIVTKLECGNGVSIDPGRIIFKTLTLVQDGRTRPSPLFAFSRPGINEQLAHNAKVRVASLHSLSEKACSKYHWAPADQRARWMAHHDDALRAAIEMATRFEAATTAEKFQEEERVADDKIRLLGEAQKRTAQQ